MIVSTPRRFYGGRKSTASARLLCASASASSSTCWTPNGTSRRSATPATPRTSTRRERATTTPLSERQVSASGSTPQETRPRQEVALTGESGDQGDQGAHFQPGETLDDRVDLYAEHHSDSEGEEGDFRGPITGGSVGMDCYGDRRGEPAVNNSNEWSVLLQKQQAMLLQVIQQQDVIKQQNIEFKSRLEAIEDTVASLSSQSLEHSGSTEHHRSNAKIPKDLTVSPDVESWEEVF